LVFLREKLVRENQIKKDERRRMYTESIEKIFEKNPLAFPIRGKK